MKMNRALLVFLLISCVFIPALVEANSGDFSGGVAIGTSYAGVDTAPTNGLIVQGNVGIGTSTSSYPLVVAGPNTVINGNSVTTLGPIYSADQLAIIGAGSSGTVGIEIDGYGTNPALSGLKADGTASSPTAVVQGDRLFAIGGQGYTGSGTTYNPGGDISLFANSTFSSTNAETYIVFDTTPSSSTTRMERMRITSGGNVGIGTTSPVNMLDVNGAVAIGSYAGTSGPSNGLIVSGLVGIGTSSVPVVSGDLLDVYTAAASTNSIGRFVSSTRNAAVIVDANSSFGEQLIFDSADSEQGRIGYDNGTNSLRFNTNEAGSPNTNERMRITSGGEIGIANTSPSYLLQVGSSSESGIVMELQNSSGGCTYNPGASSVTVSCSSDMRLKSDIQDSKGALAWIDDMRIRDFTVKATGERKTGVVAQEVELKHPEMVHENAQGTYLVDEPNPWKLVRAIQEQQEEINELKKTIEQLRQQNNAGM